MSIYELTLKQGVAKKQDEMTRHLDRPFTIHHRPFTIRIT